VKEPIHVVTNGSPVNPLKEPIHVAINESSPLTLEEQVQHIVVFVLPSDQLNYNYVNSLPHPPFPWVNLFCPHWNCNTLMFGGLVIFGLAIPSCFTFQPLLSKAIPSQCVNPVIFLGFYICLLFQSQMGHFDLPRMGWHRLDFQVDLFARLRLVMHLM